MRSCSCSMFQHNQHFLIISDLPRQLLSIRSCYRRESLLRVRHFQDRPPASCLDLPWPVPVQVGPVPARSPDGIANALEDDVSKSPTRAQQDEELEGQPGEMRSGEPTELPGRGDHPSTATYNEADNWAYSAKPARGSVGDELSNKYVKGNHQTEWKQWKRGPLDKCVSLLNPPTSRCHQIGSCKQHPARAAQSSLSRACTHHSATTSA